MDRVRDFVEDKWETDCLPQLEEYIKIPCQSPAYDPEFATNGLIEKAMDLLHAWVQRQDVLGLTSKVHHAEGRSPLMLIQIAATSTAQIPSILMYGHMDKQPPLRPWADGLDPYVPVRRDDKLYGRAGADDGYAVFAAVTTIQSLQKAGMAHGPITVVIEADEESGSPSLPFWIESLRSELGTPNLIFCLDSGPLNYDTLWLTTSLRGAVSATLSVELLSEGVHSGLFGGIIPCTFKIIRQLLSRVEDETSGEIRIPEFHVDIPLETQKQAKELDALGADLFTRDVPLLDGCHGFQEPTSALALANTWQPCLAVTGISGLPAVENAGNVLRPRTVVTMCIRLPPTAAAPEAFNALKKVLERDPPYGAKVKITPGLVATGWAAPQIAPWLEAALDAASEKVFQQPHRQYGLGGTIPFMGMLGKMFPKAQFVITGVLGPKSNAHGPNEFLHIPYTKKIVECVASIVASHAQHFTAPEAA